MTEPLAPLLADGVIDEVVARLKSGKEADVWLVRHGAEIVAAKVYKARHARNFKNNAAYKEGRQVRSSRTQRAMDRGSRFGQAAAEDAWKAKESDALYRLHAAGVRVPRPVLFFEGVLLMEVVLDADGHPAPRLIDAPLAPEQAAAIYADLRKQAIGMLACDLIHGDLSPYNVLVGWNGPVVIDLPQVVDAAHNSQARSFFLRDLENIHRFCASLDPALRAADGDGPEIWRAYERRELTADFVPTGRSPEPQRHRSADRGDRRGGARPAQQGPRTPGTPLPGGKAAPAKPGPAAGRGAPQPATAGRGAPQPARAAADPRSGGGPRPHRGGHPGSRPHDGGHARSRPHDGAQGGSPASPRAAGERRGDRGGRRNGPMPEVIRVVRLDRPPHGASGGAAGAAGDAPPRRRRRGRR